MPSIEESIPPPLVRSRLGARGRGSPSGELQDRLEFGMSAGCPLISRDVNILVASEFAED